MRLVFWLSLLLCLLSLSLAPLSANAVAAEPRVVVGIKPVHSLVTGLMEGIGTPELAYGGIGVPYGTAPEKAVVDNMAKADLVIWVGPEVEEGLAAPIAALGGKVLVLELLAASELKILPVKGGKDDSRDPFIWLDSRNAMALVDVLADALAAADPDNAGRYLVNRRKVKQSVAHLDRAFEYGFRAVSARPVFLYHDTQQYFAQAYALKAKGSLVRPGDEAPEAAELLGAVTGIRDTGAACLLVERGLPSANAGLIAGGAGVPIVEIDSFATDRVPGPDLYAELMRANFQAISGCAGEGK